jgi:DNA processing protein
MDEPLALLSLARARLPARRVRDWLHAHGSAAAGVAAGCGAWVAAGLEAAQFRRVASPDPGRLAADVDWLADPAHHLLAWHQPDYPLLLREVGDPPAVLFVVGEPALAWHPQVAIVGSRRASAGGLDNARAFARAFAASGWGVASGLAAGVDTQAHVGALEAGGPTVAVVGCGPDRVFPRSNAALAARVAAHGAIVSEYPPGTPPAKAHFPQRNRIIAGLALATVVVEAAERSGALITARLAADAGREVFAVPGSIHNPMARGCHRLLRQGAGLVESPAEVTEALAPLAAALGTALRARLGPAALPPTGAEPERNGPDLAGNRLLRALGHDPVNLDQLATRSGLTVADLAPMLLAMELDGRVIAKNGRYVRRT